MNGAITNPNEQLQEGQRYLLFFRYSPLTPDVARKLSDEFNVRATFLNKYGSAADVQLEGTTVTQDGKFVALVKIKGTPLLAAIAPIVAVVGIITAGVVLLTFLEAVLVQAQGASIPTLIRNVGGAVESTGEGLLFGLPIVAVGASVLLVLFLFGALAVRR